jgi:hypothetical protein
MIGNWKQQSGQLHNPAALPLGKQPLVPTAWEVGWAPVWMMWRTEKSYYYHELNTDSQVILPIG